MFFLQVQWQCRGSRSSAQSRHRPSLVRHHPAVRGQAAGRADPLYVELLDRAFDRALLVRSVNDADEQIAAAYDVSAPPQLIVIDQHGNIVKRFLGTVVGVTDILDTLH